ncbi:MAG: hypothetical protein ABIR33_11390 [Pyrinomonadaceae bacterium]
MELPNSAQLEGQLKKRILSLVHELRRLDKRRYTSTAKLPQLNLKTATFISRLARSLDWPDLETELEGESKVGALSQLVQFLTMTKIQLEIKRNFRSFAGLVTKNTCLGYLYAAAVECLVRCGFRPAADPAEIASILSNAEASWEATEIASRIAESDIKRARESDRSFTFYEVALKVTFDGDFNNGFDHLFVEMSSRLISESLGRMPQAIDPHFSEYAAEYKKTVLASIDERINKGKYFTRKRLDVRRGGRRPKRQWTWDDDAKRLLYLKAETLKDDRGRCLWKRAYNELVEADFGADAQSRIRNKTELRTAPRSLWKSAINAWQGSHTSSTNVPKGKSPTSFRLMHAAELLGFKASAVSTLAKYSQEGKRLHEQSDRS